MSTKVERLISKVNRELTGWATTRIVKNSVGDSIENNRSLSVRQAIRYLRNGLFTYSLSVDLEEVYSLLLKKGLFKKVRRSNKRTDAFDINELNVVLKRYVSKDSSLKSVLGRNIQSVL